jgi:hypothetical protein
VHRQVGALWKVLSQQTIGVLVRPALPRALRIAKIYVDFGRQRKATMIRKFLSPIPGQGLIPNTWTALIIQVKKGSSGDAVRGVQEEFQFRNESGDPNKGVQVDGIFGPQTDSAVRDFNTPYRSISLRWQ